MQSTEVRRELRKPIILTIGLHKGGAGKTITTVEIAKCFVAMGLKVCVVDMDPQGNSTKYLIHGVHDDDPTIADLLVLTSRKMLMDFIPASIRHGEGGVDVLPATGALATKLGSIDDTLLFGILRSPAFEDYDFVLIDTPPSESPLMTSAYIAADYFLAVFPANDLTGEDGVMGVQSLVRRVKKEHDVDLRVIGAAITRVASTSLAKGARDMMEQRHPGFALETVIHERPSRATEALVSPRVNLKNPLEEEYFQLAKEVYEIIAETEEESDGEEEV